MNRFHQFAQGLGSSWLATFATVAYSLLSVPVALKHLSVDEFGLFVLLLQVSSYFALIEIGMSAATARILVDYKDRRDEGTYGSVILTGFCFFAVQAFLILATGTLASPLIVSAIGVPAELAEVAIFLLQWLAVTSALAMAFRIYGSILYANKRLDLIHAFMGINMLLGLVLLYFILATGGGLSGLIWLFLAQSVVAVVLPPLACRRLGLLPGPGRWSKPSLARFRELFGYGKDIFLINVGSQVLEASQLMIITRTMGLTAAASWSVSTKLFALVFQLVTKIEGTAIVFFAEMMVRGEQDRLAIRFRQVYQLTAAITVVALAVVTATNLHFVSVWAEPSLAWAMELNILVALYILINVLTRCSSDLIIHTKNIAAFRYVYFVEATVFVTLALWSGARFGFYGILGASILCLVLFRVTYTTRRMAKYFRQPACAFWWSWLKSPIAAALILAPFVLSADWLTGNVASSWAKLFIATLWVGTPGVALLYFSMPQEVRREILLKIGYTSVFGES